LPWDPFATFNVAVLIHSFVHIGYAFGTTKIAKVFVPKARKQHSRNGPHGKTLPEANCNRYLPSIFVPKIPHVILISIHAEGTKYAFGTKTFAILFVMVVPWARLIN
jgi:hypothetical protein